MKDKITLVKIVEDRSDHRLFTGEDQENNWLRIYVELSWHDRCLIYVPLMLIFLAILLK